jgi:thiol-disulfide isomerase/thioredoxin
MMKLYPGWLKKHGGTVLNISLVTALVILIFVPDAKSWMMRQLILTGLFNVQVDKQAASSERSLGESGLIFTDTSGTDLTSASLSGKIVFINFWATWCPPCRAEMPSLNKLYKEFENDKDIVFLFVSEDEEPAKALQYLRSHQYKLPLYTASGGAPGTYYSGTLPTTLVFNKDGKLIHKKEGMANYNTTTFISTLRALQ